MTKRRCQRCGSKMKFLSPGSALFMTCRWYKCTQCDYTEWVLTNRLEINNQFDGKREPYRPLKKRRKSK